MDGAMLPELSLQTFDGATIPLSGPGAPRLLYFWTASCGFCQATVGDVRDAWSHAGGSWALLGITPDDDAIVRTWNADHGLSHPQLRDVDGRLAARLGLRGTPAAIALRADGTVLGTAVGGFELPKLLERLAAAAR